MAVETLAIHSTVVDHDFAANYYHTNLNHFLWLKFVNFPTIYNFDRVLHLSPTISSDRLDHRQSNASPHRHYYNGNSYFGPLVSMFFDTIPSSVHCSHDFDYCYYYLALLLIDFHVVLIHPVHLNR